MKNFVETVQQRKAIEHLMCNDVGTVWIEGSDKSLNELQVEGGFATKVKREELK